ncbi:MBOAT family protein [Marinilabilia salmonicolor]|uniref:D-alanyl-lipoteichoic acid acyltransferase DltB (MBOAT superfamily) n=1 Tax=Marinilabilia salmonicolor TaxID=989 RepID=A0A368UPC0_9BACT|nr:MBOAT family O-acyltransferase [Marinilabilia salmonicolor]RCW27022.1 D-alanyl-lipoteichoic acid acyltransferase DltB (MBOAT superfamily) [Marinilabilia salmonicolor]
MLFNSIEFAIFLPVVFLLYWFVVNRSLKAQNFLLLAASYLFYGWWDWRFLSLIAFSSVVDYVIGLQLHKTEVRKKRRLLLTLSILTNLGFLGFFKYYNFFVDSFVDAVSVFGYHPSPNTLNIILPVGISFYTFQTLSYTIDIYRRTMEPTKNALAFFAFVSFFPQLVAGPIERASNLLPQFKKKRIFTYKQGSNSMRLILWGLFKKIVIADNAAIMVNQIFKEYETLPTSVLLVGAFYFALQIYGDFSGYSDIARGTAKLFGFELMINFRVPYFSRDIAEFWRRWHISLSTWFRDYLYIPLGGSRGPKWLIIRNTFIIFVVSGFWHGANWTFIIWGFLNALYFLPLLLTKRNRRNLDTVAEGRWLPNLRELFQMGITFTVTTLAWVFFRAESVSQAFGYFKAMLTNNILPDNFFFFPPYLVVLIGIFILLEWFVFRHDNALERIQTKPAFIRHLAYVTAVLAIIFFMPNEAQSFIYFQF